MLRKFASCVTAALAIAMGCVGPVESDAELGESEGAIVSSPTVGGPYGNYITYRCTAVSTAYCVKWTNPTATTQAQINTYLDNARRNWGCGGPTDPRGYVSSGEYAGSQWQWYWGAGGSWYGCVAWWNSKRQAAYVMINDQIHANNVGTSPELYWRWADLGWYVSPLGMPISNPIPQGSGQVNGQWFANGLMTSRWNYGAHYVLNDLAKDYREHLGMHSATALGAQFYAFTGDQQPTVDDDGNPTGTAVSFFDAHWGFRGYLTRRTGADKAFTTRGPNARAWDVAEGRIDGVVQWAPDTGGKLGFPTSNLETFTRVVESNTPLERQSFDNGIITWAPWQGWLNTNPPRPTLGSCASGYFDQAGKCTYLNGKSEIGKCTSTQPGCQQPTDKYGTRYSTHEAKAYVTAELPFCSAVNLQTIEGYWYPCRDGDGRLSNLGALPNYATGSQTACRRRCRLWEDGGLGGYWNSPCFNDNGEYSRCGEYGVYSESCTSKCLSKNGTQFFNLPGGANKYNTPCVLRDGTPTQCGPAGYAIDPQVDPDPPPPACSSVCSPVVACSGMACMNGGSEITCKDYGALPCGKSADFVETTDGQRFRFTISSPLVTGPTCGGDSDGDCLDNTMENQLALAAAPRFFYDENESCGGGADFGGVGYFTEEEPNEPEAGKHCHRVDLFQVRPFGDAGAMPYFNSSGVHAGAVSSWQDDDTVKTVVIRYIMAYPYQIVSLGGIWLTGSSHVGDLEWIEVGLQSADLTSWQVTNVWLSHHGPVDRQSVYTVPPAGPAETYAAHMARVARFGTPNGDAIINVATDEDTHGSWAVHGAYSDNCDGNNDGAQNDCFWTPEGSDNDTFRENVGAGWFSSFDASRNIGGIHYPEHLRIGGFPGPVQIVFEPNWQGPNGVGVTPLYTLSNESTHSGTGVVHEFLNDTNDQAAGTDWFAHEKFAGWKCPNRTSFGNCAVAPHHPDVVSADGGCFDFDVEIENFAVATTPKHIAMAPGNDEAYCYTLWGVQSRRAFTK